jgi:hypothetical protein
MHVRPATLGGVLGSLIRGQSLRGAAPHMAVPRRSPLNLLHNRLGAMVVEAKRAGRLERAAEALIEMLRLIAH